MQKTTYLDTLKSIIAGILIHALKNMTFWTVLNLEISAFNSVHFQTFYTYDRALGLFGQLSIMTMSYILIRG